MIHDTRRSAEVVRAEWRILLDAKMNDRVLTGREEAGGVQEGQIGWAGGAKRET